ncbi:MAG: presenilin family intramembrane aspartyl protease [archaeon]
MKHNLKIITILLVLFFLAQFIGLIVTSAYMISPELPLNIERPEMDEGTTSISLFMLIVVVTLLAILLINMKFFRFWRLWFLASVFLTLTISFFAFIKNETVAIVMALVLALWKVYRSNIIIHNLTEVFIYGALAVIFAPLLNIFFVAILLVAISVYDYIAVRKTKHMIKLAKAQSQAKVFAGILVPYGKKSAILGGGDIAFPLLFAAVIMQDFGLSLFNPITYIVPVCVSIALAILFLKGEPKKFYPAMPYLTVGCFVGYGLVLLFSAIL